MAALCAAAALLAACSSPRAAPPASLGVTLRRPVPAAIRRMSLTNQYGHAVDLASFAGKTVLLVPFLTLCSDICPMTTGNLVQVQRALVADHAASSFEIVELSVDPGRDSPARLAAYAKVTGATWQLVTESPRDLAALAKYFGFYYQTTPEDTPPSIDWWTGQPLTYDIDHSDGFVVIDPHGAERFATTAAPDFHGALSPTLKRFLSDLGRQHLDHPAHPGYTPADILAILSWATNRTLPGVGG